MPSIDQLSIEIEASAKKAMPELDNLINKLTELGNTLSLIGSKNFKSFNGGINRATKNIDTFQNSINHIDTAKLDKLADSMERLSKTGNFGMSVKGGSSASGLGKGIGQFGRKAASVGKGILTAPYKAMATGMNGVATASVGAAKGLKSFFSSSGVAATSAKNLVQYFASLYARVWALRRVLSSAMSGIQSSMDLVETYHYFETVYDKIGKESKQAWADYGYESAEAYAQSFRDRALQLNEKMSGVSFDSEGNPTYTGTKSLGLDADLVMQYQAQYAQQAYGIGMVGEAAEATSRALTMLAGDWSSLRNISFEQSYSKMASALAGQSRAVRSLGIDITQAALANTAANLGIETSVSKMNQAQKAELRMIAILEQSRVAWGDLAKTLNTPANQMRMLEQNLKSLARTIGSLFLPIVAKVLPYINGLVIALQRLFQWLGKLLGVSGAGSIASQGGMGDLGDDFEDLADSAEDAQEEAEELKNTILSFDELNVLNDPNKNKKDKETGMSAAEQALLDQSLLDLLDEYEKAWNEAWARMQSKAQEIADKLTGVGKKILDFIRNGDWANLGKYLADGINQGLEKLYNLLKWENVKGRIEPFVTGFAKTLNSLIDNVDFDLIGRILGAGLNTLVNTMNLWYENFDFINLGKKLAEGIRGMIDEIDWLALGHYLGNKFMSMWNVLYGFVTNLPFEKIGDSIAQMLNGWVEKVNFGNIADTVVTGFNGIFTALQSAIDGFNWALLRVKLKIGINHFVNGLDLESAASTIASFLNKAILTMISILNGNWPEKLANKFNRGLDRFINEFKFDQVGQALRLAVDHLILILYDFVQDKTRFQKLGVKFASTINEFLAPKKTALTDGKLGEALAAAFNDFFAFIEGLVNGDNEEEGINWTSLRDIIVTNLQTFITEADFIKAAETISEALVSALGTLKDAADKVDWEELGRKVGEAIGRIDWPTIINDVIAIIKDIVGGLWEGLGETFGGSIVQGIIGYKVATSFFLPFANMICVALTGETIAKKLGWTFKNVFSTSVEKGATDAGTFIGPKIKPLTDGIAGKLAVAGEKLASSALSGNLMAVVTSAGLTVGVSLGFLKACKTIGQGIELLQGGNGTWTDEGNLIDGIIKSVRELKKISPEQSETIWKMKEEMETAGASAEEITKAVIDKFNEYGISVETVETALGLMEQKGYATDEMLKVLRDSTSGLSTEADIAETGVRELNAALDFSNAEKISGDYSLIEDTLRTLTGTGVLTVEQFNNIDGAMNGQYQTTQSLKGWYDQVIQKCEDMGVDVQAVAEQFRKDFPEAVSEGTKTITTEVKSAVSESQSGFQTMAVTATRASNEIKTKAGYDFKETEKSIVGSVKTSAKETDSSYTEIGNKIEKTNKESSASTDTEFGNLRDSSIRHMGEMKGGLNTETNNISTNLRERFQNIAHILPYQFDGIGGEIANRFRTIPNDIQQAVNEMGGNLRNIGIDIVAAIQQGLLYNPLKLPHIVQDSWNPWSKIYDDGNGNVINVPNFKIDWYAKGGLFTTPTLAGFGEAGDEAALPLSNKGVMSRIANAIVDNSDGFGGMTQEDMVEAVATGVAMAMSQNPQTVEVIVNSVIKTNDEKLAQAVARGRARLDQRYNATPVTAQ